MPAPGPPSLLGHQDAEQLPILQASARASAGKRAPRIDVIGVPGSDFEFPTARAAASHALMPPLLSHRSRQVPRRWHRRWRRCAGAAGRSGNSTSKASSNASMRLTVACEVSQRRVQIGVVHAACRRRPQAAGTLSTARMRATLRAKTPQTSSVRAIEISQAIPAVWGYSGDGDKSICRRFEGGRGDYLRAIVGCKGKYEADCG